MASISTNTPRGSAETWTVGLPAGRYDYVCDVPFHIGAGMVGTLVVTP